jgi:hypothetical protein
MAIDDFCALFGYFLYINTPNPNIPQPTNAD